VRRIDVTVEELIRELQALPQGLTVMTQLESGALLDCVLAGTYVIKEDDGCGGDDAEGRVGQVVVVLDFGE
jgi:hypothetical protein